MTRKSLGPGPELIPDPESQVKFYFGNTDKDFSPIKAFSQFVEGKIEISPNLFSLLNSPKKSKPQNEEQQESIFRLE